MIANYLTKYQISTPTHEIDFSASSLQQQFIHILVESNFDFLSFCDIIEQDKLRIPAHYYFLFLEREREQDTDDRMALFPSQPW